MSNMKTATTAVLVAGTLWLTVQTEAAMVYYAHGYHGGYYLTDEAAYRDSLDKVFALLEASPDYRAVLELEPYTLERMQSGERFACERHGREAPLVQAWSLGGPSGRWEAASSGEAAHSGAQGLRLGLWEGDYIHACQPLPATSFRGHRLVFSGWARARSGGGAHLYVDAWDASRFLEGSARQSEFVPVDGEWHRVEVEFPVPPGAVTIFPQAKINPPRPSAVGRGRCTALQQSADFDDLSLRDADTGEELLRNGGFEDVRQPDLRDPERLERLRGFLRRGQAEIVGGTYTQPILYAIGDESVIRQFSYGCAAVEETLGVPLRHYAAQEPVLAGQLPQLLRQLGFEGALLRTHWAIFGSPPHRNAERVRWIGPDGTAIDAIPPYEVTPLSGYGLLGVPWPEGVRAAEAAGLERPLFSLFGDLVPQWVPDPASGFLAGQFGQGWANLCRRLPAEPLRGQVVVLSGQVRARQPGAHLYIDAHGEAGYATAGQQSPDVAADGKWHRVEIRFRVPDDAVWLFPQGRIIAPVGDADFDALSLTKGDQEFLPEGSFEASPPLPEGWGVGTGQGTNAEHEVVPGDAADGQRFVRLRERSESLAAKFTTLAEYFAATARSGLPIPPTAERAWDDPFAQFTPRFPWGLLAGEPQRADRFAEDTVLFTERLFALAGRDPGAGLREAWRLVLMNQHHDGWVCAPVLFGFWRGYGSYAEVCAAAAAEARQTCARLLEPWGIEGLTEGGRGDGRGGKGTETVGRHPLVASQGAGTAFVVVNVAGRPRQGLVPVALALPRGVAREPTLVGPDGVATAAQVEVTERYDDGSAREVHAYLRAAVPGLGYARYEIRDAPPSHPSFVQESLRRVETDRAEGRVRLSTPTQRVEVGREGLLQVFASDGTARLREPAFLAGDFAGHGEQRSRIESVTLVGRGRCTAPTGALGVAVASGRIADVPFTARVQVEPESPLVRLSLDFDFGDGTVVGAAEDAPNVPAFARDEHKLRLVLPLPFAAPRFYAHGAFEVRPVSPGRWMLLRFAGAEGEGRGVAVFSDRATALVGRADPASLEVVLAYGGRFIYAPGESAPLRGRHRFALAVMGYDGDSTVARLPERADDFAQPLLALPPGDVFSQSQASRVRLEPDGAVMLTAAYPEGSALILRLWRPYPGDVTVQLTVPGASSLARADLRGRPVATLAGGPTANLTLPSQGILTVRAEGGT